MPGTEQRNYLLDKLAEHARLRAESTHGRVESKNDPRMQAERLKLAHESMSKLFRDKDSPFKNDFRAQDLWSGQRAEYAKQMERHLQKHPELREEFGKYTSIHDANPPPVDMTNRPANWVKRDEHGNPILSDAEKERRAKLLAPAENPVETPAVASKPPAEASQPEKSSGTEYEESDKNYYSALRFAKQQQRYGKSPEIRSDAQRKISRPFMP